MRAANLQSEIINLHSSMSQPEIYRRCTGCGASFREGALFCPQCGSGTTPHGFTGEESGQEFSNTQVEDQELVGASSQANDQSHAVDESSGTPQESQPNFDQTMPLASPPPTSPAAVAHQALAAKASEVKQTRTQTGTQAGRPAPRSERRAIPGVDKLRKGTSIVIDEAAVDPSLRFVLIAGLLFLLFVVLLVLSKWMN